MNKKTIIFITYIFLNLCYAIAQTDTLILKEVIINENRAPFALSDNPKNLEIIELKKIQAIPTDEIGNILEGTSGIDIRERGNPNIQADVSINGSSYEQIAILIDGVKISDPQTGHHSFNIPIDIDNIERIEVFRGSGTRIFGLNAATGAINIVTSKVNSNQFRVSFYGGQHQMLGGNVCLTNKYKKYSQILSASNAQSDGYIENTDYKIYNGYYNGNYDAKFGSIKLTLANTSKNFGANGFYSARYPSQFERTITSMANIKGEFGKKFKIIPIITYRRNQDRFELFRESTDWYVRDGNFLIMNGDTSKYILNKYNKSNYYTNHNYHLTHVISGEINANFNTILGKTAIGAEYRSEDILSNVLGNNSDSVKVIFEVNKWFTKSYKREISNFFVEQSYTIKKLTISSGIFALWNKQYNWNLFGGSDVSYKFNEHFQTYISANQSVRLPSFTDLYYKGADRIGNVNLKPEKVTTYELGERFIAKNYTINGAIFYRQSFNTIDWVRPLNSLIYYCQNHTQLNAIGFNTNINVNLEHILNKKYIKYIDISYSYTSLDKETNDYESLYALDYLKTKIKLGVFHQDIRNLYFNYTFIYQDRAGTYNLFDKTKGVFSDLQNYQPFITVDAKIIYKWNKFDCFLAGNNLFNKTYFDYGNIEMPGRWLKAGIRFSINY